MQNTLCWESTEDLISQMPVVLGEVAGIAVKDGSKVIASDIHVSNYRIKALMTYIKKDFYGIPSLSVQQADIKNIFKSSLRQNNTQFSIDGINVMEENIDVTKYFEMGTSNK